MDPSAAGSVLLQADKAQAEQLQTKKDRNSISTGVFFPRGDFCCLHTELVMGERQQLEEGWEGWDVTPCCAQSGTPNPIKGKRWEQHRGGRLARALCVGCCGTAHVHPSRETSVCSGSGPGLLRCSGDVFFCL